MTRKTLSVIAAVAVLLFSSSLVLARDLPPGDPGDHVPGEILVGFEAGTTFLQIGAAVSKIGGEVTGKINLPKMKIRRVRLGSATQEALDEAINKLKSDPSLTKVVHYAERNVIRRAHGLSGSPGNESISPEAQTGDPLLTDQWGYYDIGANWVNAPTTLAAPKVAVIDTGVDYTHSDLAGRVIKGRDYVNNDADPMDDNGHGTHVAGIIAAKANNRYGITGISYNSKILAIKAATSQGLVTEFDSARGITYAANCAGVKVINVSYGGPHSTTEEIAVDYAVNTKGKLLVASAGNDDWDVKTYPAAFADDPNYAGKVLAVAAHDTNHCRANVPGVWGSNYGTWVSISAPGMDIFSTIPNYSGSFGLLGGTSMAAAHVAGAAALVWAKYPTKTNAEIGSLLTSLNAGSIDPLDRTGGCWPADGSSFERLSILHILEQQFYEDPFPGLCGNKGSILGFAFDAETGEPLSGAKVTAKQGTLVTGIDYVSYYGQVTNPFVGGVFTEGYGLFNILATVGMSSLSLQKSKYAKVKFSDIDVPACNVGWAYAGTIPVPPALKPYYWIVVTWDDGFGSGLYDSWLNVPAYGSWPAGDVFWDNPGDLNGFPYARLLWDSHDVVDQAAGNRRAFSEAIRIKKVLPGTYTFRVDDFDNQAGSTSWSVSGIKVYVYRWDAVLSQPKLVATFTPPPGSGRYWYVFDLVGNKITPLDNISDF